MPTLLPATSLGRAAAWLLAAAAASFLAMNVAVMSGQTGGDTLSDNPWLAAPALAAGACVVAAAALAGAAMALRGERSALAAVAFVIGLIVIVFLVGESFGHD